MEQIPTTQKIKKPSAIEVKGKLLIIVLNGKRYEFQLDSLSNRLKMATQQQLENFSISPSGYGIHWQEIDEDLSIPSLISRA